MPYAASHERMLRADDLYDACIVLDWNIGPRRRGRGSAIFFHLARPGFHADRKAAWRSPAGDGAAVAAPVATDGAGRQTLDHSPKWSGSGRVVVSKVGPARPTRPAAA